MGEAPPPQVERALRVEALSVGVVAARALIRGRSGTIRSVFERSFYATIGDAWICFGPQGLGAGPLNVLCASSLVRAIPLLRDDISVSVYGSRLRIGDELSVTLDTAEQWAPPPAIAWGRDALARGLVAFDATLTPSLPREGLASLLSGPPASEGPPVARIAQEPTRAIARLVREDTSNSADKPKLESLARLLGLGPGLTPSGDDFLGGAMVALTRLGMRSLRDEIWSSLEPLTATHTNDISRAHLAAAAEGYGSEALHGLLEAILAGASDEIPRCVAKLAAVGHTSGWDAMAGAVTVLRAVARA